jgi:hypothetical protein
MKFSRSHATDGDDDAIPFNSVVLTIELINIRTSEVDRKLAPVRVGP